MTKKVSKNSELKKQRIYSKWTEQQNRILLSYLIKKRHHIFKKQMQPGINNDLARIIKSRNSSQCSDKLLAIRKSKNNFDQIIAKLATKAKIDSKAILLEQNDQDLNSQSVKAISVKRLFQSIKEASTLHQQVLRKVISNLNPNEVTQKINKHQSKVAKLSEEENSTTETQFLKENQRKIGLELLSIRNSPIEFQSQKNGQNQNQSIQSAEQKILSRTFYQAKEIAQQSITCKNWSSQEKLRYVVFLQKYLRYFQSHNKDDRDKIFYKMSQFIQTKNINQSLEFHKRNLIKMKTVQNLIKNIMQGIDMIENDITKEVDRIETFYKNNLQNQLKSLFHQKCILKNVETQVFSSICSKIKAYLSEKFKINDQIHDILTELPSQEKQKKQPTTQINKSLIRQKKKFEVIQSQTKTAFVVVLLKLQIILVSQKLSRDQIQLKDLSSSNSLQILKEKEQDSNTTPQNNVKLNRTIYKQNNKVEFSELIQKNENYKIYFKRNKLEKYHHDEKFQKIKQDILNPSNHEQSDSNNLEEKKKTYETWSIKEKAYYAIFMSLNRQFFEGGKQLIKKTETFKRVSQFLGYSKSNVQCQKYFFQLMRHYGRSPSQVIESQKQKYEIKDQYIFQRFEASKNIEIIDTKLNQLILRTEISPLLCLVTNINEDFENTLKNLIQTSIPIQLSFLFKPIKNIIRKDDLKPKNCLKIADSALEALVYIKISKEISQKLHEFKKSCSSNQKQFDETHSLSIQIELPIQFIPHKLKK